MARFAIVGAGECHGLVFLGWIRSPSLMLTMTRRRSRSTTWKAGCASASSPRRTFRSATVPSIGLVSV